MTGKMRGHGEGSIRQRPDGRFEARVMLGYHEETGKPDRRSVYGKTRAEVVEKLDELRRKHRQGILGSVGQERDKLAAYLESWLQDREGHVRPRTLLRYRQLLQKHVIPVLGRIKLVELKTEDVRRCLRVASKTVSPQTVSHIRTVLANALGQAMTDEKVARNVAKLTRAPAIPYREMKTLSGDQVGHLLDVAEAHEDRLVGLWGLSVYTGMRLGELTALTWNNIDLDAGTLRVRWTLVKVTATIPTFGEPKTDRSRREVPLSPEAVAILRAHKRQQTTERLAYGPGYDLQGLGLVFATVAGTPISSAVVMKAWRRALKRADLPAIRFHDLRHTAASLMIGNGVDLPTVSAILGHARTSTTLDFYAHAGDDQRRTGAVALGRSIRRKTG